MKELLKKKSVKICILLVTLMVVMGIVGINVRSAQRSKEYDEHIAAAEKYLTELDYEQAIAEYTAAFEIDPKEEVVNALEQTYIAYAQSLADAGDYEKAVSILEEGYEKIGRESVQNKIEEFQVIQEEMLAKEAEIQEQKQLEEEQRRIEEEQRASGMIELPFQLTDITVMGYDLFENHFSELEALFPIEWEGGRHEGEGVYMVGYGTTSDGLGYDISDGGAGGRFLRVSSGHGNWIYFKERYSGYLIIDYYDGSAFDYPGVNVPITAGETYEDWCRVMQADRIKENNLRPEERNGRVGIWGEDDYPILEGYPNPDSEDWLFSSGEYQGIYSEVVSGSGLMVCQIKFGNPRSIYRIEASIQDGVITRIVYEGY